MTTNPPRSNLRYLLAFTAVTIVACVLIYLWLNRKPGGTNRDAVSEEATKANSLGVGYMEQFEYAKAAKEFKKAAELAPDWRPARINLGMALYNSASKAEDPVLPQAIAVFEQILKEDPDNPYAHFNLGIITKYRGEYAKAAAHFEAVTKYDPSDDRAWLYLGQSDPEMQSSTKAKAHFEKALSLNPYLVPARYAIANHLETTAEEQAKLHELNRKLQSANWEDEARPDRHSEQGRYATVIGKGLIKPPAIGPMPMFDQTDSLKITGEVKWSVDVKDPILAAVRKQFGGVVVRLDFNKDGKTDLLLLSAANRNGKLCDVLLRNDGDHFTDVSESMGLLDSGSIGAAVGDFNNDGWPDLALTTANGVRLLRNDAGKKWVDQTAEAGFDKLTGPYLCAAWLDIDQDGDLDLLLTTYGDNGALKVMQNVGVAAPSRADEPVPPLSCAFRPIEIPNLSASGKIRGLIATDIDGDKDVDLVVLFEDKAPLVILNDRLMRFHVGEPLPIDSATNGLVLDTNGDDQSDLFFLSNDKPMLLNSQTDRAGVPLKDRFAKGPTDAPAMLQAQWCDLDYDGRCDVVGLSRDDKPVFLHGDGLGKLASVADPFGPNVGQLKGILAVAVSDLNNDCQPDLFVWTAEGPKLFRGQSNGNRGLRLSFTGKRDSNNAGAGQKNLRTNTDGIGTRIQTLTGPLQTTVELTTLSSGPGQSLVPIEIGIGRAQKCDALRIRWPDCVVQAELETASCELVTVGEINRKPTSCPVIMTWDSEKWVYVTDCLGGSALGESGVDGTTHLPRTGESVKIESSQLGLKSGQYVLRIAEPMDEVMYLDRLQLLAIDHPKGSLVYPDERFAVADPQPTEKPQLFGKRAVPVRATDHRGVDWTATIAVHDGKTVDGFAQRSWLGFAEEHWLELDFGNTLQTLPSNQPLTLALAGWTDYPYPESIIAASQADIEMAPPVLERKVSNGKWEKFADLGFPAGLPKVMTVPLPDSIRTTGSVFRIRTNLQIYWDHAFIAVAETPKAIMTVPFVNADLSTPGFVRELKDGPTQPQRYDPNDFERVAVSTWAGKLTKHGNVTELLTKQDDRFVICGPGDEVTVSFDAKSLPPIPEGHVRSFILKVEGYCKDTAPTTQTGDQIDPLPYRAMKSYPTKQAGPTTEATDRANWHTRPHQPAKTK